MGKGGGGGGSQTVNTQVEPPEYAKPFLEFGLAEAKDQFMSDMPGYYPGSSVVGFSPESEMALTGVRERALDPNSLTAQTQGVVQQNLMGTNPLAMAAFKPYSVSLARATASASEPTGYTDTTGPKVSLRQTSMSSSTPVRMVGSKKYGPMSGRG